MVYDDFLLPGQKEFEKLAKEYSSELQNQTLNEICQLLKRLQLLYEYVVKNLRSKKLKSVFFKLANNCQNSFLFVLESYPELNKNCAPSPFKRLLNLNACIRLAIYSEAELVEKMQEFCTEFNSISCIHLNNIKTLTSL